jgi:hypothetical protein
MNGGQTTFPPAQRLDDFVGGFSGRVGYAVANLGTGERLTRNADLEFPTASTIKLPILTAFHAHADRTGLDWDAPVRSIVRPRRAPEARLPGDLAGAGRPKLAVRSSWRQPSERERRRVG